MDIFGTSALISSLTSLFFGVFIFFVSKEKKSEKFLLFMSLAIALWGVSYYYWMRSGDNIRMADIFVRLLSIGALFSVAFFSHWALYLTKSLNKFLKIFLYSIYALDTLAAFLFLRHSDIFIDYYYTNNFALFWPLGTKLYLAHIIVLFVLPLTVTFYILLKKYFSLLGRKDSRAKDERYKILTIVLGALFGFGGASLNFLPWFNIIVPPYGNLLLLLYPPMISYAAIKHGLINIKVLAIDIAVFFLVISALIQVLLSRTYAELIWRVLFLIVVLIISVVLIKTFKSELEQKKEIEKLLNSLEKANEHLKKISQKKSEFLSIATHQLRAPVAVMRGQLSLVLEGSYGEVPEYLKKPLQKIFDATSNLAVTITDFLNVSRIEQGKMVYHFETVDLKELCKSVIDDLKSLASEKGLELKFNICHRYSEQKILVHADKDKLRHVIYNLVENAIKYTKEGYVKLSICVNDLGRVRIEVQDTGVGIAKDELKTLFDKFVRSKNAYGINVEGSGLGLYIAREMIYAHNGRIWATSEGEGKGSTFIIELPLLKEEDKGQGKSSVE